MDNKDAQFWEYIKQFNIIGMVETWIEEKRWSRAREHLPEAFRWRCQSARREKKKGRAIGGIITGIRKEITEETEEIQIRK